MISITVQQLINTDPIMGSLWQQKQIKGRAARRIQRLVQKLRPEVVAALDARQGLATDENSVLVDPAQPDGPRNIKPECLAAFLSDPLFADKVSLDADPLTDDDIADAFLSPEQCEALGPLLVQ